MSSEKSDSGNNRNYSKMVKSSAVSFQIDTPKDRQSSYEPELIKNARVNWPTHWSIRLLAQIGWACDS
jgi:transposase-like protein